MRSNGGKDAEQVARPLLAAISELSERSLTPLSDEQLVQAMRDVESCMRRLTAMQHRLLIEAEERSLPSRTDAKTVKRFLMETLRISSADAGSRVNSARRVATFHDLDGELRDPQLPCTAAALTHGEISADHVRGIAQVMNRVPRGVSDADREAAE